ncbi:MAG: ABC transporter ATP-binding protein [Caldilinea sp.]|nr:ABC transporter ATP-binding protein [Caldilinea sp.]
MGKNSAEHAEDDRDPVITMRDVTKTYQMGAMQVHALRGVSLEIAAGEYVAIVGASGSGKSTLMNIIGLLDWPTSGAYAINGVEVARLSKNRLADLRNREIGFVFQRFHLLPRTTARRQVELPLFYAGVPDRTARRRALDALAQVGLGERVDHRPDELSGGQQQRVAIARALVTQPSILLADEPTGALDSQTGKEVMALFHELNEQGITLIVVTHDLGIASQAQRIITLRDGEIISDAPAARQTSPFLSASTNGQGARPAIPAQEVLA